MVWMYRVRPNMLFPDKSMDNEKCLQRVVAGAEISDREAAYCVHNIVVFLYFSIINK